MWWVAILLLADAAEAGFDDASWKARIERTYSVRGEVFTDTFHVWVDYGAAGRRPGREHALQLRKARRAQLPFRAPWSTEDANAARSGSISCSR